MDARSAPRFGFYLQVARNLHLTARPLLVLFGKPGRVASKPRVSSMAGRNSSARLGTCSWACLNIAAHSSSRGRAASPARLSLTSSCSSFVFTIGLPFNDFDPSPNGYDKYNQSDFKILGDKEVRLLLQSQQNSGKTILE